VPPLADIITMALQDVDAPPPLLQLFINSTDTLRRREIEQRIPTEWNDKPPLFFVRVTQRRRFWRGPQEEKVTEDEDPNLLKGVSTTD
jgi:hypothetical protein